jgi:hypothetical protein
LEDQAGWEDNKKTELKELEFEGVMWLKVSKLWAQVLTVLMLRVLLSFPFNYKICSSNK